jgi:ribosomal protein L11 methyltransferase
MWTVSFCVPTSSVDVFSNHLQTDALSLSTFEVLDDLGRHTGDQWQIDVLFLNQPERPEFAAKLALIAISVGAAEPNFSITRVREADWVAETLQSFQPMVIGRFWVHGSHDAGSVPSGMLPLCVDAATAFGTGEHATTHGCLLALNDLAKRSTVRRAVAASPGGGVLDVGCGTGILAFGAARLWPGRVLASDIDPEAVRVAQQAAAANGLIPRLRVVVAAGLDSRVIAQSAPYAVITANILARPLCNLAPSLMASLAPRGRLVLSGLLETQVPMVMSAYRAQHLVLERSIVIGEWATLILRRASSAVATSRLAP